MSEGNRTWYHGSPFALTSLRPGSIITPNRHLATIFSHKPAIVCIEDDGTIKHSGTVPGYLYAIAEAVRPEDVYPHPTSTMAQGMEYLTRRELALRLLGPTQVVNAERLSEEELAALRRRLARA